MLIVCIAGIAYCAIALFALVRFLRRPQPNTARGTGVTILKPIHGLEVELFENLRSFCDQDYPRYQVIFGVQRTDDPAIEVIQRVIACFPERDLTLVVDGRRASGNPKVANLANMIDRAKYELLFIADADMRVDRRYLAAVGAEFEDDGVGAATCLYAGVPRGGLASQLAALHFNDQFAPSVLVATLAGPPRYCFGSTMAVRRSALEAIGGIAALSPYLADDYMLGALISAHGYHVALSRYVVRNVVAEPSLAALLQHELRWARTIRSVQTVGYVFSFVTFPLPFAVMWVAFAATNATAWAALAITLALRTAMHFTARSAYGTGESPPAWLIPLRDCLGLAVWAMGLFGNKATWRGEEVST
ncbi:MAG: bacteriohopanetetrol glucosamine biosynthesis glycosyltransferase HpnI [Candidatus Aquilonibacter sp.]